MFDSIAFFHMLVYQWEIILTVYMIRKDMS